MTNNIMRDVLPSPALYVVRGFAAWLTEESYREMLDAPYGMAHKKRKEFYHTVYQTLYMRAKRRVDSGKLKEIPKSPHIFNPAVWKETP